MKVLGTILAIIGLLFVAILAKSIGRTAGQAAVNNHYKAEKKDSIEEILIKTANDLNKQLPMTVDKDTILDTTVGGPGKQFTYLYTLVNFTSRDITEQQLNETLAQDIKKGACTNRDMSILMKNGVQVTYRYRGNDGGFVGNVVVSQNDCVY